MVGLVLPVLLLSVASDSEGSNEEDWAERFRKADEARRKVGIPLLTPREKMRAILGEVVRGNYVIGVVSARKFAPVGVYVQAGLFKRNLELSYFPFQYTGHFRGGGRYFEILRDMKLWAKELLIPWSTEVDSGLPLSENGYENPLQ